jgi:predicted kinase
VATSLPLVVIVGGAPASGKSTLAEWLAGQLRLPLFSRDAFKERLMDTLGSPTPEDTHQLGAAAYAMLALVQQQLIGTGAGFVVESNFVRGESERDLRPLLPHANAVLVHCTTTVEESTRRFEERAERGDRHPGHHDTAPEKREELEEDLEEGRYDPLELPVPILIVDTTDGFDPGREEVLAWIRRQHGR